jgi:hypothetical protein
LLIPVAIIAACSPILTRIAAPRMRASSLAAVTALAGTVEIDDDR